LFPIARCPALSSHASLCCSRLSRPSRPYARSNRDDPARDRYAQAIVAAASKACVHSGVIATAKDRTQAATPACRDVRVALLGRREIRRCLLQSRHHAVGFSFPDLLGSALPLVASLHKELASSPQQERHVMVSSGDMPLVISMDIWFAWDPGESDHCAQWITSSWICPATLMSVRNKYKSRCKWLMFKSLFSLV
jgi:hypothetical protein